MNAAHGHSTKNIYPQLDNTLNFRVCRIKEIKDSFSSKKPIKEKEGVRYLINILWHLIM